jgi:hypothetical protein
MTITGEWTRNETLRNNFTLQVGPQSSPDVYPTKRARSIKVSGTDASILEILVRVAVRTEPAFNPADCQPQPNNHGDTAGEQVAGLPDVSAESDTIIQQRQCGHRRHVAGAGPHQDETHPAQGPRRCRPSARGYPEVRSQRYTPSSLLALVMAHC